MSFRKTGPRFAGRACAIRSVSPLRLSVGRPETPMAGWLDTLRHGGWLTLSRLRLWAFAILVASGAGLVYLMATSNGLNDYQGRPLGTDFSNIYVAGTHVLEGLPEAPFDPRRQFA